MDPEKDPQTLGPDRPRRKRKGPKAPIRGTKPGNLALVTTAASDPALRARRTREGDAPHRGLHLRESPFRPPGVEAGSGAPQLSFMMRSSPGALLTAALLLAPDASAERPSMDVFYVTLLAAAGAGLGEIETAAWLVRGPDGRETLVPWPPASQRKSHAWNRPLPAGAVALLHTHPASENPRPSVRDRDVARRIRMPVYAISRWAIYRADPDGTVSPVASPCWTPTIDWAFARRLLAVSTERALVAEASSGRPLPDFEGAVR